MLIPEIKELKSELKDRLFRWNSFNFNTHLRGFFLNLVNPMMKTSGYLVSLVKLEDLSPHRHSADESMISNFSENLEIKLSSSETQKVKLIQEFVCKRYKISNSTFLSEIKKKTRTKSLIREGTAIDDSLVGQYVESHETKNPIKSIKLFNMNTLKHNVTMPNMFATKSESMHIGKLDRASLLAPLKSHQDGKDFDDSVLQRINAIAGADPGSQDTSNLLGGRYSQNDNSIDHDVASH